MIELTKQKNPAWAIELATAYPETKVLGTDLSPIQPELAPENVTFIVDDANKEWSFNERFDLIHTRSVTMGISSWDKLVGQAETFLQPGGWLELQEFRLPANCDDATLTPDHAFYKWGEYIRTALEKIGIDSLASMKHGDRMRAAGFENIKV